MGTIVNVVYVFLDQILVLLCVFNGLILKKCHDTEPIFYHNYHDLSKLLNYCNYMYKYDELKRKKNNFGYFLK